MPTPFFEGPCLPLLEVPESVGFFYFNEYSCLALRSLPFGKMILDVSFSNLIYSGHDQIFNKTIP